jgi:hypothetical protein
MKFFRVIFWVDIIFIGTCILIPVLMRMLPVEFASRNIEETYEQVLFTGFPIAILFTLSGTIKPGDSAGSMGIKFVLTLLICGIVLFFMISTTLAGMCNWTTLRELFVNKHDHSVKIVERGFGCGATDGGEPSVRVFKTENMTNYLIWVTPIDTNLIDRYEWIRTEAVEE